MLLSILQYCDSKSFLISLWTCDVWSFGKNICHSEAELMEVITKEKVTTWITIILYIPLSQSTARWVENGRFWC